MDRYVIFSAIIGFLSTFGLKLLWALLVFAVGYKSVKLFIRWFKKSSKLDHMDLGLRSFLSSFLGIALYAVLAIVVATILGIPATSFITILASCGVAIGLALQGSLSNVAGGIMILLFKPFKIGDFIEVAGESGTVKEITIVYTVLKTGDNKIVTLPNGSLTNSTIKNYSKEALRRVDFTFGVSYASDIGKVKAIIEDILASHPKALQEPAPFVRLSSHGDSALTFTARVWCNNADYWDVYFDVTEKVKEEFDKNGIEIPYPQLDVHVDNK